MSNKISFRRSFVVAVLTSASVLVGACGGGGASEEAASSSPVDTASQIRMAYEAAVAAYNAADFDKAKSLTCPDGLPYLAINRVDGESMRRELDLNGKATIQSFESVTVAGDKAVAAARLRFAKDRADSREASEIRFQRDGGQWKPCSIV